MQNVELYRNLNVLRPKRTEFERKSVILGQKMVYRVSQKSPIKKTIVYLHHILAKWADFFSDNRGYFQFFLIYQQLTETFKI
jgi:hypothetical protein